MKTRFMRAALLAFVCSACGGDPHFDHLYYSDVSSAPGEASLRPRAIEIAKGIAVRAQVAVVGDDNKPMGNPSFQSSDPNIFGVDPGPHPGDFVFFGVDQGSAELDVYSEYGFEASLPVTVVAE